MRPLVMISTVTVAAMAIAGCQTLGDVVGVGSKEHKGNPAETSQPATQTAARTGGQIPANGTLAGMSADNLRSLWGEPTLKRTEPGAELWQYGGTGGCTLLIYLYPGAGEAMTVSRAEALPGGADDAAVAACAKAAGKPPLTPVS